MIIVEGPDGSGKSTLINNLGFDARRLKSIRGGVGGTRFDGTGDGQAGWGGTDPALLCYARKITQALEQEDAGYEAGLHIAYDRFHLSEVVYGPILRAKQELDENDLTWVTEFLRANDVKVVMCLPPFEVTLAKVRENGRERPAYQSDEFLQQAYREFERLAPLATIVYDFTKDPLPTI